MDVCTGRGLGRHTPMDMCQPMCRPNAVLSPVYYPMHYDADRRRRRRLHRRLQRHQCLHLGALHLHGWQLGDIRAPPNDRQAASAWAPIEPGQCRSVGRVTVRGARQAGAAGVASMRARTASVVAW